MATARAWRNSGDRSVTGELRWREGTDGTGDTVLVLVDAEGREIFPKFALGAEAVAWLHEQTAPTPEPEPEPEPPPGPEPAPEEPPVVVGPVTEWAQPKPRAKRVVGVTAPTFEEDTYYEDCPGLVVPRNAKAFTVVGGISLPTITAGWQDFWIGGREGQPMNAGPRTDGKDLNQTKMWPVPPWPRDGRLDGDMPQDGVFAFIELHDLTRPNPPPSGQETGHPDGFQIMAGRRLTWGGCVFRDMGEGAQPFFIKSEGESAGGGPVEDLTLTDSRFERITHWWSIRISDGVYVPTRITLRNVDLGGKNAAVWEGVQDLVVENVTGGEVKRSKT